MKNIFLMAMLVSASSVTYAEIIGSGIYSETGQEFRLMEIESDGTDNKTGNDGTDKKIEGDGSNKTGNDGTDKEFELMLVCG